MKEWLVFLPIVREDWDDMIVGMTIVDAVLGRTAEEAMAAAKRLGHVCPVLYEDPKKYSASVLRRAGPRMTEVRARPMESIQYIS